MGVIVTDWPLHLLRFLAGPSSYASQSILRVPGGCQANLCMSGEGAPQLRQGDDVFVFLRDYGDLLNGRADKVIVAPSISDVAELKNGIVSGDVNGQRFVEFLDLFESHFH
jgi:hypothetical protein